MEGWVGPEQPRPGGMHRARNKSVHSEWRSCEYFSVAGTQDVGSVRTRGKGLGPSLRTMRKYCRIITKELVLIASTALSINWAWKSPLLQQDLACPWWVFAMRQ